MASRYVADSFLTVRTMRAVRLSAFNSENLRGEDEGEVDQKVCGGYQAEPFVTVGGVDRCGIAAVEAVEID